MNPYDEFDVVWNGTGKDPTTSPAHIPKPVLQSQGDTERVLEAMQAMDVQAELDPQAVPIPRWHATRTIATCAHLRRQNTTEALRGLADRRVIPLVQKRQQVHGKRVEVFWRVMPHPDGEAA